ARPSCGPVPISASLGRRLTDLDNGLFRSLFSGQGNAMLLAPRLRVVDHRVLALNAARYRRATARTLGLGLVARPAWGTERRTVPVGRVIGAGGRELVIANLHCTGYRPDHRVAEAELLRAAWFTVSLARPEDVVVLAGDLNLTLLGSETLRDLTGPE